MQDPKITLLNFLEAIEYKDDKQAYVNQVVSIAQKNALLNLSKEFQQAYSEEFTKAFIACFQTIFSDVFPSLTEEQKKKVDQLLSPDQTVLVK